MTDVGLLLCFLKQKSDRLYLLMIEITRKSYERWVEAGHIKRQAWFMTLKL